MSLMTEAAARLNRVLRPLDIQLVRGRSDDAAVMSFLSARKTIAAAKRSGLSVSDYIDRFSAEAGATASTVEAMLKVAELHDHADRVCEIGPGTGRYAERVIAALQPSVYEMYETATDWLPHLRRLPGSTVLPADGHSLGHTASGSVDLVHAQKVFVYLPLVVTVGYLQEMARVARPGGTVAFDIVTEACMDEEVTKEWVATGATLYSMIPRQWTIDLADRLGLVLRGQRFRSAQRRADRAAGLSPSAGVMTSLIDEFPIALSPVLFGSGIRLFEGVDAGRVALEQVRAEPTQRVTPTDLRSPGTVTVPTSALPAEVSSAVDPRRSERQDGERSGRDLRPRSSGRDLAALSRNFPASSSSERGLPRPPRLTSTRVSRSSMLPASASIPPTTQVVFAVAFGGRRCRLKEVV